MRRREDQWLRRFGQGVLHILREFRDQGYGVLVISSEPETVLAVSDRVVVMSQRPGSVTLGFAADLGGGGGQTRTDDNSIMSRVL